MPRLDRGNRGACESRSATVDPSVHSGCKAAFYSLRLVCYAYDLAIGFMHGIPHLNMTRSSLASWRWIVPTTSVNVL